MYDQFNQIAMLFVHPIMKIQPHLLLRERERDIEMEILNSKQII